ncbi:MAG TPA: response regulator transcription factor [Niallia sp.]|nr:response regulator transcription factor [Niallia sp.]
MKILVVEDNISLLESIKIILESEYTVDTADNGEDGLFYSEQNIYDLIILDVMLPHLNGFEIVQRIRKQRINTPVLFLTAKDSLEDRVKGLEYGGDDYLVKPFQEPELQARIKALLRRSGALDLDAGLKYKEIVLTGRENDVMVKGSPIKLTIKQYELLEYLIQNNGKILTKEQIFDRIWGFDSDTTIAIVEVFIHQLRKKLEPFEYHKDIQTVRGVGYILKEL